LVCACCMSGAKGTPSLRSGLVEARFRRGR
jgi:hypothetical protein